MRHEDCTARILNDTKIVTIKNDIGKDVLTAKNARNAERINNKNSSFIPLELSALYDNYQEARMQLA
jgi:hypothetical protein